jgi:DNA-binding MarR family transcriptional regulator
MLLSPELCAAAEPKDQPFKLFDGQGLYLLTQPNGRKYWRLKYRFGGKEKLLSLGVFPEVTLDAARDGGGWARDLLARGIDPSVARRAARRSVTPAAVAEGLTSTSHGIKVARNILVRDPKSWKAPPLAEMPRLDGHLCFALYAAGNHMNRLFVPFLKALGVTYPQYLVLVVLWERGSLGGGELASALGLDFGTVSPLLQRLERKGLITRGRHAVDQRRIVVSLTRSGAALRKRTQRMLGEFYCFLNVPVDELVDLKDRLHRFVRSAGPSRPETDEAVIAMQPG